MFTKWLLSKRNEKMFSFPKGFIIYFKKHKRDQQQPVAKMLYWDEQEHLSIGVLWDELGL